MHDKFVALPCKKRRIYWEQFGENADVSKTYLIDNQWAYFFNWDNYGSYWDTIDDSTDIPSVLKNS